MLRRTLPLFLLALICNNAWTQTTPATTSNPTATSDANPPGLLLSRIGGLFGVDLPQLDLPGTVKLVLRPHFGDFLHRDYARVDTGLRWALDENFELTSEAAVYFTHGFGHSAGYGIGKLTFGSRYVFESWPKRGYESTLDTNIELPTGNPPVDMTDGHYHFAPNFVIQHQIKRYPRLTAFSGLGLDLVRDSHVEGTWGTNQPHDNSVSVTTGGVYDVGQIKWTMSATYATTALIGDETHHFVYLQPGLLWYVPSRYTFHSKTQWIVGLGARTTWGPDGFDFSLRSRLRAEITFRQVMDKIRQTVKKPDTP